MIEAHLARLATAGHLDLNDPAEGFRLFYGLVVQGAQTRALLGERPPAPAERSRRAVLAVDRFLAHRGRRPTGAADPTPLPR